MLLYFHLMRKFATKTLTAVTLLITLLTNTAAVSNARDVSAIDVHPSSLYPTKVVQIKPPYGYVPGPVRVRLSKTEQDVVRALQKLATTWQSAYPPPENLLEWEIEESARNSRTLALSMNAFRAARAFLSVPFNAGTEKIVVIVGRTQNFIKNRVAQLGCNTTPAANDGQYLMGATICNRRVIIINLTGYFFLTWSNMRITPAMEQRSEPPIRATLYTKVDRNLSGLAHEWVHVARNRLTSGFIPDNEPAWFREGLAEIISGLSRVQSSKGRMTYMDFHVIRLRKFSDWSRNCLAPLRTYRETSEAISGCEYLRGAAAMELLLAQHGGLPKILELFANISATNDFLASFRQVYGFSLSTFEKKADTYASYIRYVSRIGV